MQATVIYFDKSGNKVDHGDDKAWMMQINHGLRIDKDGNRYVLRDGKWQQYPAAKPG